jgi:hypothetical protein
VLFLPYSNAQKMSTKDTKEAIISAIEFCNGISTHDGCFSYNIVMIYESFFNDKVATDIFVNELNRNKSDIFFIIPEKLLRKRIRELKETGLSSIMVRLTLTELK